MTRLVRSCALAAAAVAVVAGCSGGPGEVMEHEAAEAPMKRGAGSAVGGLGDTLSEDRARAPGAPAAEQTANAGKPKAAAEPSSPQAGRYIIRSAGVTLQVKDVRQAMGQIQQLAAAQRGFVSDSNLQADEGREPTAVMTLRVPATRFDELLNALGGVGVVRARQVSGQDVTVEFVDTDARVRNLKREELELLKLLERAGKLSEVLEVERELARVRGEIETAQGRLRQLSSQVELATIQVSLSEAVQVVSTSPWQLGPVVENAWSNAQRELAGTVGALLAGAVWFVAYVLPVGLPAALLFALVGWALRRWLVDKRHLVPATIYDRCLAAAAVALLAIAFPPLLGLIAVVAIVAVVIWALSAAWRGFKGKSAYKD